MSNGIQFLKRGDQTDLVVLQGASGSVLIEYKDSAGAAIPLTGYSAKLEARRDVGGPVLFSRDSSDSTEIEINEAGGTLTLKISEAESSALPAQRGLYDLKLYKTSTGSGVRLIEGSYIVRPQVTV